jgi:pimeloyl-ACP methyl ester carboxylesterase
MSKAAVFIHGWVMDDRVFHRKWIRELKAPLYNLMKNEFDCEVYPVPIPGNYIHMDKDYDWYARHIMKTILQKEEWKEIVLIGHSMGAMTVRALLQREHGLELDNVKKRITRAILLGAPNFGTGQPLANTLSRIITKLGSRILPKVLSELTTASSSFLEETPCYRALEIEGEFLMELNTGIRFPEWTKVDNIWTMGDTVVEPTHSAILPGVDNHLIGSISMNHFNITYRKETLDKVRSIMKGTARPSGPQSFPPVNGCSSGVEHLWWPEYVMPLMHDQVHWKCRSCGIERWSQLLPDPFGCQKSFIKDGPHNWARVKRSHSFKYRCRNCGESIWHPNIDNMPDQEAAN